MTDNPNADLAPEILRDDQEPIRRGGSCLQSIALNQWSMGRRVRRQLVEHRITPGVPRKRPH